jgi:hypothetical protein
MQKLGVGENVMLIVRSLSLMALLIVGLSMIPEARAENQETLTLSCDGKLTNQLSSDIDTKTETVIKMGILVNLAEGTVMGFSTLLVSKRPMLSASISAEKAGVRQWMAR